MLYLVQQIILCLMLTALIGIAVGWLLRGAGTSRQTELVEARWQARVEQLQRDRGDSPPPDTDAEIASGAAADQREQIEALKRELATLRTAQAVRQQTEPPDPLSTNELHEREIIMQQLQGQLAEREAARQQLENRYAQAVNEKQKLVERLRELETRSAELTRDRQHALDTITDLQKQLRAAQRSAPPAAPQAPPSTPRPAGAGDSPATSLTPADQQSLPIPQSVPKAGKAYHPGWRLTAPDGQADKLQAIHGIGPKFEKQLNQLGVFHFRQIAAFTANDIAWVEMHLGSFPGRILRDRWVEQARALEKRRQAGQPI